MKHNYTDEQLQAAIDGACLETHREHRGRVGSNLVIDTDDMPSVYAAEESARLDLIKSALAALPEPEPSLSKLRPLSEAAEPADPYAELKAAHAAGKIIQINCYTAAQPNWIDLPCPEYFGEPHEYRIKPETETFEPTPYPLLTKSILPPTQVNDGGPAFPCETYGLRNGKETTIPTNGMSLRDWFAGMALQGKATRLNNPHEHRDILSSDCYDVADAMIAAREVKP